MLTAGAIALAVIAPALDPVEHAAEAVTTPPQALPATPELPDLPLGEEIQERQFRTTLAARATRAEIPGNPLANRLPELMLPAVAQPGPLRDRLAAGQRATRSIPRRAAVRAVARVRPVVAPAARRPVRATARTSRVAERPAARELRVARAVRSQRAARPAPRRVVVHQKRTSVAKRGSVSIRKTTRSTRVRKLRTGGAGKLSAVVAFARAQVGARYVRGGEGRQGFDCSGFTKRAYAQAGLSLPHSSGAQARRARVVPRSQARPGDLVVGPGHVGIYMGRGMMIDAGNHRTGVVYRKVYRGLKVARL